MQFGLALGTNQRSALSSGVSSSRSVHKEVCMPRQHLRAHTKTCPSLGLTWLLHTIRPRELHRGHPQTATCHPYHPGGALLGHSHRRPSLRAGGEVESMRAHTREAPPQPQWLLPASHTPSARQPVRIELDPRKRKTSVLLFGRQSNQGPCTRPHRTSLSLGGRWTRLHPGQHDRDANGASRYANRAYHGGGPWRRQPRWLLHAHELELTGRVQKMMDRAPNRSTSARTLKA